MREIAEIFEDNKSEWISELIDNPRNLATEQELGEQAKVSLKLFQNWDKDGSNTLTIDELKGLCDHMGLPVKFDEETDLLSIDKDGNGNVDIEEFAKWWLKRVSELPNPMKQQEVIAGNTFKKFDENKSGSLDRRETRELLHALGTDFTDSEMTEVMNELDEDKSNEIELSEFVTWWTNRAASNRKSSSLVALKLRKLASKASQMFHTDIFTATWNGNLDLVKSFIKGDRRFCDAVDGTEYGNGWRPLHYACYQGHLQIVQELLDAGAKPNVTTGANATDDPMFDDIEGDAGVGKAFQSPVGFTPLFYAAQRGHLDVCEELMSHRADPTLFGYSPDSNTVFMSPVEHCVDYPGLSSIFVKHTSCTPPIQLTSEVVSSSTLTSNGTLSVQLVGPKDSRPRPVSKGEVPVDYSTVFGPLPVSSWEVTLMISSSGNDEDSSRVTIPAVNPNEMLQPNYGEFSGRSVSVHKVGVDKEWVGKVKRGSNQSVTMTIRGSNGMGAGQWSERLAVKMLYPKSTARDPDLDADNERKDPS